MTQCDSHMDWATCGKKQSRSPFTPNRKWSKSMSGCKTASKVPLKGRFWLVWKTIQIAGSKIPIEGFRQSIWKLSMRNSTGSPISVSDFKSYLSNSNTAVKRKNPTPLPAFAGSNFARVWRENLTFVEKGNINSTGKKITGWESLMMSISKFSGHMRSTKIIFSANVLTLRLKGIIFESFGGNCARAPPLAAVWIFTGSLVSRPLVKENWAGLEGVYFRERAWHCSEMRRCEGQGSQFAYLPQASMVWVRSWLGIKPLCFDLEKKHFTLTV